MHIKTNQIKKIWDAITKVSSIGGIVSFVVLVFGRFPISQKIDNIQQQLNAQDAQQTLISYFSYIEQGKLDNAFNLFSQEKKYNHTYTGFVKWLDNFVAFEGLKITPIKEKDSAIQKVFLVEFGFKKRGLNAVETKRGMYLTYNNNKREIKYSNVLYENGRKTGACSFYPFEICKQ